jgi:hypothetical protein
MITLTCVRITNVETVTYFVKKPPPDKSDLDFSTGHFGMEVHELDMLVFNQKVVHGQHRNKVNAACWTFFVSLVDPDDRDYKDGVPDTSHNQSNVIAHELGFFNSSQWSYDAVQHFLDHPEILQQYIYSHQEWEASGLAPDDGHASLMDALKEHGLSSFVLFMQVLR